MEPFLRFFDVFPADEGGTPILASRLVSRIHQEFGIDIPNGLHHFWDAVGGGYFGNREFFVFSESQISSRDSAISWNKKDFWRRVFPAAKDGGPFFFAENSFGEQLGFRWETGRERIILFVVDTFESFVVAESFSELFENVLVSRDAITDTERLDAVRERLGRLPEGMHYAPIVSPMVGGSGDPSNFDNVTPNVHFRTAIATYEAVVDEDQGTPVEGIDVEFI